MAKPPCRMYLTSGCHWSSGMSRPKWRAVHRSATSRAFPSPRAPSPGKSSRPHAHRPGSRCPDLRSGPSCRWRCASTRQRRCPPASRAAPLRRRLSLFASGGRSVFFVADPARAGRPPAPDQGIAAAQMVVEKTQGLVLADCRQPQAQLGQFHRQRPQIDAVNAGLRHPPPPIGQFAFVVSSCGGETCSPPTNPVSTINRAM